MSSGNVRSIRLAWAGLAALGLAVLGWALTAPGSGPVPRVPLPRTEGAAARPVPRLDGWRLLGGRPGGDGSPAASSALYRSDEPPLVAALRADGRFRAAGWTPLPALPPDPAGRHLLGFRAGDAVCWVLTEPDPRGTGSRCAVMGP